jgi:bacteriocin biosynthesis cyclodehydratase domain-containing protein
MASNPSPVSNTAVSNTAVSNTAVSAGGPAAVRLRPHHPVLRRGPDALQLGVLPGRAVEAAGLSPPLLTLLLELNGSWPVNELVARAVGLGAREADVRALLADLRAEEGLLDAVVVRRAAQARQSASVLVRGGGPLLAPVTVGLAAAGIGALWVEGEFTPPAQGEVRRLAPDTKVRAGPPRRRPHLVVLTDLLAPDPRQHREFLVKGVPQLVVRLMDGIGLVGPLVLPGRSACLRCLDLHRAARDPCWPTVAAGLSGQVGSASPATVQATAALAVEQAMIAVEPMTSAEPPPTLDAVLELDTRRGTARRRRWPPHPECGCGAAHIQAGDAASTAATRASVPRPGQRATEQARAACGGRSEQ